MLKRLKFFIIYILFSLLNITIANGMILDEKYSNNSNETILEVLNNRTFDTYKKLIIGENSNLFKNHPRYSIYQ